MSAVAVVMARDLWLDMFCVIEGRYIQTERKMALISIPAGTTERLSSRSESPCAEAIPRTAGTMVVGTVPRAPPTTPPYLSISTVTSIATNPAAIAAGRISPSTHYGNVGGT